MWITFLLRGLKIKGKKGELSWAKCMLSFSNLQNLREIIGDMSSHPNQRKSCTFILIAVMTHC